MVVSENKENGTITFTTADLNFRFTVKDSIPWKHVLGKINSYELVNTYKITQYLHNSRGPAVENLFTGLNEYYFDGKWMDNKEAQRFIHGIEFNNTLETLIKE